MNARAVLALAILGAATAGGLAAQGQPPVINPGQPTPQQQQPAQPGGTTDPWGQYQNPYQNAYQNPYWMQRAWPGARLDNLTERATGRWSGPPQQPTFQGFPVFPSQLSGYGNYPLAGGLPSGVVPLLAPAPDEPPGWPAWARTRDKEPLPFAHDLALLIRHTDRVWQRPAIDEPFVPLYFHDKLRTLQAGAAVEVRQNGEFTLLVHRSTRFHARGPTAVEIVRLDEKDVHFRVGALTWMRLGASERAHTVELPDGSVVFVDAPAPAAVPSFLSLPVPQSTPIAGVTDLLFVRVREPSWLGGRATLTNLGSTEVRWRHATGEVKLGPSQRLTFFLQPPAQPTPAGLVVTGAVAEAIDGAVVCRAAAGGSAAWCGARFELPPGASVRFDPQQGRPFDPPQRPAGDTSPPPR